METDFIRDYAMYAAIFGIFGFSWFGWAQANPPKKWPAYLGIASGISFIIGSIGIFLAIKHWGDASALKAPGMYRTFGVTAGIEFALIGLGVGMLFWLRKSLYVPSWVAFILGVHFIPLAMYFQDPGLYVLAAMVTAVSLVAPLISKKVGVSIVTLTGVGVGVSLFIFAVRGLVLSVI